jgi:hypothetical protein
MHQEVHVRPFVERKRPREQRAGGTEVTTQSRTYAGGGERAGGLFGKGWIGPAELGEVVGGLFEVMAEDLLELDELLAVLFEPGGEALVQLGADRLGEGVVGGVADQQVAEAVGVFPGVLGPVGADELLADERNEPAGRPGRPRR